MRKSQNILVTGGAGFIGSNFVRYMLKQHGEIAIINLDALTYAGNLENLDDVNSDPRYTFVKGDIRNREDLETLFSSRLIDAVVHMAAESHVDRSIAGAGIFVETNVLGTQVLLEAARNHSVQRFVHVSTDEVYGSLGTTGRFTESTPLHPNSPYAASKAGSDLLALAYQHTYGLPVVITRCSNNYGPYQFPEKLIPLMTMNALQGKPLPVYGDGLNVRDWIYVGDHCAAIDTVLQKGVVGEVYNIGGNNEWKNIDIVKLILRKLNKSDDLITFVKDRPGHDRRYAIDASKITAQLGWTPVHTLDRGIADTIDWYLKHQPWSQRVMSGEYQEYYKAMYHER